tara:strand:+ start:3332 stop:3646 length:315 start_codon:yes stop_codon:yes gene_type:complete
MMLCPRCNIIGTQGELCSLCQIRVAFSKKPNEEISEQEKIERYSFKLIEEGCQECGNRDIGFQLGTQDENELKWYIARVHCERCDIGYEQILEVKIRNESIKNN